MVKYLILGAVFVASLTTTCGDFIIHAFNDAIKDRIAIIESIDNYNVDK